MWWCVQDVADNAKIIYRYDLSRLLHSATRLSMYAKFLTQNDPDDPRVRQTKIPRRCYRIVPMLLLQRPGTVTRATP